MTPIKIPETLKPDVGIIYGYTGGMGLYLANWKSVLMIYSIAPIKVILTVTKYYSNPLN